MWRVNQADSKLNDYTLYIYQRILLLQQTLRKYKINVCIFIWICAWRRPPRKRTYTQLCLNFCGSAKLRFRIVLRHLSLPLFHTPAPPYSAPFVCVLCDLTLMKSNTMWQYYKIIMYAFITCGLQLHEKSYSKCYPTRAILTLFLFIVAPEPFCIAQGMKGYCLL